MSEVIGGFAVHEVASWFPLMSGAEFDALIEDIRDHGQVDPVEIDADGVLIDGRNRVRACERLGIKPLTKVYDGDDVTAHVISRNLHRRMLTDSQRAMIAARLATRGRGQRTQIRDITHLPPSRDDAARLLDVSATHVTVAKRIYRDGTESLQALAEAGKVPITTAARVATTLPADEQDAFVAKVAAGADPVKIAPPDLAQRAADARRKNKRVPDESNLAMPQPTRMGGNHRKHRDQIEALTIAISGAVIPFETVETLDASVTSEEAARLADDLSAGIRSLNRIRQLIKERTA